MGSSTKCKDGNQTSGLKPRPTPGLEEDVPSEDHQRCSDPVPSQMNPLEVSLHLQEKVYAVHEEAQHVVLAQRTGTGW